MAERFQTVRGIVDWLVENRSWVFSGIGVSALLPLWKLARRLAPKRREPLAQHHTAFKTAENVVINGTLNINNATVRNGPTAPNSQLSTQALFSSLDGTLLDKEMGTRFVERELPKAILRLPKVKRIRKGLVFLDIDGLTQINEHYGQAVGDMVMCIVAQEIRSRQTIDACGRCGDDTFYGLLPKATEEKASRVAEQLRKHVEGYAWHAIAAELHVTCTCGYAVIDPGAHPTDWIIRAAQALVEGKRRGGNCVVQGPLYSGEPAPIRIPSKHVGRWGMPRRPSSHDPVIPSEQKEEIVRRRTLENLNLRRYFS